MINMWCVRAAFGAHTQQFVEGGYVAIGWMSNTDLSAMNSRDELYPLYKQAHPDDTESSAWRVHSCAEIAARESEAEFSEDSEP